MSAPRTLALGPLPVYGRGTSASPDVVALHGWQRSHRDFDFLLATDLPAAALDLPGFGQTPLPSSEWGSPEYADAVAEALRSKGIGPVVLVGHSFGGRVAVFLAQRHPDLVRGLVLTGVPLLPGPAGPARKPPLAFRVARALNRAGVLPDAVMDRQREKHGSADYRQAGPVLRPVLVRAIAETRESAYDPAIAAVRAAGLPVALVWGGTDTAAPASQVDTLRERLAPIVVTVAEDRGHDTVAEMRDELVAAVRAVREASS